MITLAFSRGVLARSRTMPTIALLTAEGSGGPPGAHCDCAADATPNVSPSKAADLYNGRESRTLDTANDSPRTLPCFFMMATQVQVPAFARGDRPAGFRAAQRRVADALADAHLAESSDDFSLESARMAAVESPRLASAELLEDGSMRARDVGGEPAIGFSAFLDGIQVSRIVAHDDGLPIVHGVVGAVVRQRIDRRLGTWRNEFEERLYAPRGFLPASSADALTTTGLIVADTTPRKDGSPDETGRHPLSLAESAVSAVQAHRESLELSLAESWLMERDEPLYLDGRISGSGRVAGSPNAVGVVRTHRTLYGDSNAMRLVLALKAGERSSVFAVASANGWRATVASWYLRLRESGDPLWGLVRVEVAMPSDSEAQALGARADQISRWILAEASPLALPDSRWDTTAYGIRDCTQYLKAHLR